MGARGGRAPALADAQSPTHACWRAGVLSLFAHPLLSPQGRRRRRRRRASLRRRGRCRCRCRSTPDVARGRPTCSACLTAWPWPLRRSALPATPSAATSRQSLQPGWMRPFARRCRATWRQGTRRVAGGCGQQIAARACHQGAFQQWRACWYGAPARRTLACTLSRPSATPNRTQLQSQDWRELAMFNASHYVRHLVDENGDFEMIVSRLQGLPPFAGCCDRCARLTCGPRSPGPSHRAPAAHLLEEGAGQPRAQPRAVALLAQRAERRGGGAAVHNRRHAGSRGAGGGASPAWRHRRHRPLPPAGARW